MSLGKLNSEPRYTIPEAAHYLGMAHATLRSWVAGRTYPTAKGTQRSAVLINRPRNSSMLSFENLMEGFVLQSLRVRQKVPMKECKAAMTYAERQYGIKRLLIHPELSSAPGVVFLDRYSELVDLSEQGQTAIKAVFDEHLDRLQFKQGRPHGFFPITPDRQDVGPKLVFIAPTISFGRPVVRRVGVSTSIVAERFYIGEPISDIAQDYDMRVEEVEEAVRYERFERAA